MLKRIKIYTGEDVIRDVYPVEDMFGSIATVDPKNKIPHKMTQYIAI